MITLITASPASRLLAKALAAFVGLSPQQKESGTYKGKTHLSKYGCSELRNAFYMPALSAKRYNEHLQPFVKRLEANGLAPKAIVGAVMRKLVHIIYGMLKHGTTFNPRLACQD
jgi:transposase